MNFPPVWLCVHTVLRTENCTMKLEFEYIYMSGLVAQLHSTLTAKNKFFFKKKSAILLCIQNIDILAFGRNYLVSINYNFYFIIFKALCTPLLKNLRPPRRLFVTFQTLRIFKNYDFRIFLIEKYTNKNNRRQQQPSVANISNHMNQFIWSCKETI